MSQKEKTDGIPFTLTFQHLNHLLNQPFLKTLNNFKMISRLALHNMGNSMARRSIQTIDQLELSNACRHDAKLVLSFRMLRKYLNPNNLLRLLITSCVPPSMSSIA